MQLLLTLSAKRYSDLKDFLYFLQENSLLEKDLFRPTLQKVRKEKFMWTLLKSPHVNKTAREQFSIDHYKVKLTIQIETVNRFILIFKKLPNSLISKVSTQLCLYTFNDSIVVLRDKKYNIGNTKFTFKNDKIRYFWRKVFVLAISKINDLILFRLLISVLIFLQWFGRHHCKNVIIIDLC